jgi:hypothetical protein
MRAVIYFLVLDFLKRGESKLVLPYQKRLFHVYRLEKRTDI